MNYADRAVHDIANQVNNQEQQIQAIVQAVAQGQDISQFDPQSLSAAKQYVTMKANELNKMVNSTSTPPNVTREMLRNDLDMYQGFADLLATDDPQFATAMDIAFIGAGIYATAKYGPMAAAKAKTGFGYARQQAPAMASAAYGKAAEMGQRSFGYGKQALGAAGKAIRRAFKIPV